MERTTIGLLLFTASISCCLGLQMHQLDSGVLFTKQGQMVLTNHKWNIILDYSLWSLRNELRRLEDEFMTLRNRTSSRKELQEVAGEMRTLEFSFQQLKGKLHKIQDIVPQSTVRIKRGWIDAGGKLLKTVFGTADNDDILQLNGTLQEVKDAMEVVQTTEGWQSTRIKRLEQNILNNTRLIRNVTQELNKYLLATANTINNNVRIVQTRLDMIDKEISVGKTLRFLSDQLFEARLATEELMEAIQHATQGHVTTTLLPPKTFISLLLKVRKQLPQILQLIFPPEESYLPQYYKLVRVSVQSDGLNLRVRITVPVTDRLGLYDVYTVHTFPVKWNTLDKFVRYKANDVFVISGRTNASTVMSIVDLGNCIYEEIMICPARETRIGNKTCEAQLFFGSDASLCQREILPYTSNFFEEVRSHWIYAVHQPTNIFAQCFNEGIAEPTQHLELTGSGLLLNGTLCSITGPDFNLPASLAGQIAANETYSIIFWPTNPMQLLPAQNLSYLNDSLDSAIINSLNLFIQSQQVGIDTNTLMQHVISLKQQQKTRIVVIGSGISGICVVTILLCVILYCYKRTKVRPSNDLPVHQIPVTWIT